MTSHDLRDVLNLPQDGTAPRPSKKSKPSAPRPNLKGLAREVQNLGGDNPIAIVPEISTIFKKRRQASRKPAARWEMRAFKNSARGDDSLVLRHWRRKTEGTRDGGPVPQEDGDAPMADGDGADASAPAAEQVDDSGFAKFNVQVDMPQYNDDQYNSRLRSDHWTRDETDYLLELARDFDLRWPVVWDRYDYSPRLLDGDSAVNGNSTAVVPVPKQRSMEDLKARYYEVAAKMMAVQKPAQYMTQPEFSLYETMLNFDAEMETQRKQFAIKALSRSKEQAKEEESLLLEVKRIIARQERFNEERRDLYSRLDFPTSDQDISSFKSSQGLTTLLQNLVTTDKSKKRKSLMGPDGVSPASAGPNGQPPSAGGENRRESIAAASASGGHRDSIGASEKATPTEAPTKGNKKGAQQPERRKLTEQEEQVYGVTFHDRLGSGPTFRYERVNKLFSHKSGQQQLRITNALNELDIPSRLTMPTAAVTQQFEQLVQTVTQLVDLRKQMDKLDAEIKVEQARRAEKEKGKPQQQPSAAAAASQKDGASDAREPPTAAAADDSSQKGPAAATAQPSAAEAKTPGDKAAAGDARPNKSGGDSAQSAATTNGDAAATTNGTAAANDAAATENGDAAERDKDKDKPGARPSSRPGSSGAHKRSASVLSQTSDKSSKRQKK